MGSWASPVSGAVSQLRWGQQGNRDRWGQQLLSDPPRRHQWYSKCSSHLGTARLPSWVWNTRNSSCSTVDRHENQTAGKPSESDSMSVWTDYPTSTNLQPRFPLVELIKGTGWLGWSKYSRIARFQLHGLLSHFLHLAHYEIGEERRPEPLSKEHVLRIN